MGLKRVSQGGPGVPATANKFEEVFDHLREAAPVKHRVPVPEAADALFPSPVMRAHVQPPHVPLVTGTHHL